MRRMFSVGTDRILDDAVTTAKILNAAVTVAKLQATLKQVILPMHVFGTWAVDGDGAGGGGGGMAGCALGDLTLTEAAAAFAKVYDKGTTTFANLAASGGLTGWAANYQLTADNGAEQIDDACYFGGIMPFAEVAFELGGALATWNANGGVWEYADDALSWAALTNFYDNTDTNNAATGLRAFQQAGSLMFEPPSDWVEEDVGGQGAYWIRYRITAAEVTQTPIKTKEHEIVTPAVTGGAFLAPFDGTITSITLRDGAGTLHTTADVKFVLMNFTTGLHSGLLTFAQDIRHKVFDITDITTEAGDVLGVVVIQEDGNAEVTNAVLELTITRT